MLKTDNAGFVGALRPGDIGLISANNPFAWLQDLYRKRFKEGAETASHGFFLKDPPRISEANGIVISGSGTVLKFVGDSTKCWIFRYSRITLEQITRMRCYVDAAEETSGHYSVGGILQFAKSFVTGKRTGLSDEGGVFCTEYTSRIIIASGIEEYINTLQPWEIDPSTQLNWFLTAGAQNHWDLVGSYDGTDYFIADKLAQKEAA